MLRWLIVVFLALLLISWVRPWLEKMGLTITPLNSTVLEVQEKTEEIPAIEYKLTTLA